MSDYNVYPLLIDRFSQMVRDFRDDFEEEIVVVTLLNYYDLCSKPTKIDNTVNEYVDPDEDLLWAIERVLQDFMTTYAFDSWVATRTYPKKEK